MSATILASNLPDCRGKFSYPNRPEAAKLRQEKRQFNLNVYLCAACHGFHLGRKPRRFSARKA